MRQLLWSGKKTKTKMRIYNINVGIKYTEKRKKNIAQCVLVSPHSSDVFISYGCGVDQKRVKGEPVGIVSRRLRAELAGRLIITRGICGRNTFPVVTR